MIIKIALQCRKIYEQEKQEQMANNWCTVAFVQGRSKPVIMDNFEDSITKLKEAGYEIVDIELPYAKYSLAVYYIVMPAEVSTNLSRFDGIRYGFHSDGKDLMEVYKKSRAKGFGPEARRRILLGTYVLSHGYYDAYYNRAVKNSRKD